MSTAAPPSSCPAHASTTNTLRAGCPVLPDDAAAASIDPRNNMPTDLSADPTLPASRLSTRRTISSIPKPASPEDAKTTTDSLYGSGDRWEYPSPQQFHNALRRKGMPTDEDDVPSMVLIHNFLNERCWREVVRWESRHQLACCEPGTPPTLVRFQGRPSEPTPKSRVLTALGLTPPPFDRHDWTVRRCDGREVRYVIDYYGGEEERKGDGVPVFWADVRPALDSWQAVVARVGVWWESRWSGGAKEDDMDE